MLEDIKEIVGFDLGDGETALALIRINNMANSEILSKPPDMIEIEGCKSNITAIGYYPDNKIVIGERAILSKDLSANFINFKVRPTNGDVYQKLIEDYIKSYISKLENEKRLYVIGCPSKWTKEADNVILYEEIARRAGADKALVISESLAALIHIYESGILGITHSEFGKPILLIDIGSSTTDFTLIDLSKRQSKPMNSGCDLGARLIDAAIFDY
ncbi:MAG: rod shape-determining protein, partial [Methanothrix sp.]|nr:rod shape-determining protein [Methanothrix sp.]